MSGPKKSRAELSIIKRKALEEKRKQEQEKKKKLEKERLRKEAFERRAKLVKLAKLKLIKVEISSKKRILETQIDLLNNSVKNIEDLNASSRHNNFSSLDEATATLREAQKLVFVLEEEVNVDNLALMETKLNELNRFISKTNELTILLNENSKNKSEKYVYSLKSQIESFISHSITLDSSNKNTSELIRELEARLFWVKEIQNKIDKLENNEYGEILKRKIISRKNKLVNASSFLEYKEFVITEIPRLQKEVELEINKIKDLESQYSEIYSNYALLCEELEVPKEDFELSENGIFLMTKRCHQMNSYIQSKLEADEIKRIVDEVMNEMGYTVIASKIQTSSDGALLNKILVQYSDDSAVDITITSDGQLAMEIGLMDNNEREPTPSEKAVLCEQMKDFCKDYIIFENKLKEKGVILSEKNNQPPAPAFAKIIDLEQYGLCIESAQSNISQSNTNQSKEEFI